MVNKPLKDAQTHLLLRHFELKQQYTTIHLLKHGKPKTLTVNATEDVGPWNSLASVMATQTGTVTLEDRGAISYKAKHIFIVHPGITAPGIYPNKMNMYVHTKPVGEWLKQIYL